MEFKVEFGLDLFWWWWMEFEECWVFEKEVFG